MTKAAKKAICVILSCAGVTDEELLNAVVGAEGLINSHPLTYKSLNPQDPVPLTLNHFLQGQYSLQSSQTLEESPGTCSSLFGIGG